MLTREELKTVPFNAVTINDSVFFPDGQTVEIGTTFYRILNHSFIPRLYQQSRLYNKGGHLILVDLQNATQTVLSRVDMIKSWVNDFDGFAPQKIFNLTNGQTWVQVDNLNSPCSPGGTVWIKDQSVMKVANWNFYVQIKLVK